MKKVIVVVAILAAAAACGSGSTSTTSGRSNAYVGQSVPAVGAPSAKDASGGTTAPISNSVVPAVQGPQVIRQAQLSIRVGSGSFDTKLADVRALVQREQGFVSGTDAQANPTTTNSQIRTGVITFMVPAAKFDETIDLLTAMGKVQNEHISGNDVSAQYVDLQARLGNEEAQRNAMLALLQRASSVADIIAVQNQLGQITGQIEQLKGQIAYIDHNTAYSTVTVDLAEAGAPVQSSPQDNWGFVTALSDAAHNFVATMNYLITGLGAVGPVVILLGFGYLLWRRRGFPGWPSPRHA
ncbi:MAG TPA: DUF4349 domain-containing protein [Candidatus Dormibacteraeota bacterium]|nr:DUF4349 domain-containing protein [Candidatus Dormibacteraeota bacterium]